MTYKRLKHVSFHAWATKNQAVRWHYWSRKAGYFSIGRWLAVLANREVKAREIECGAREPSPSRPPVR